MGLGGVATAALPSVVRLQMVFSDRLGGHNFRFGAYCFFTTSHKHCRDIASKTQSCCHYSKDKQLPSAFCYYPLLMAWGGGVFTLHLILYKTLGNPELGQNII